MDREEGEWRSKHGNMPELPDDIIKEILACLPAKSLRRFCCVSFSWAALLASDAFIELHLHRANHRRHPRLFHPWSLTQRNREVPVYSWEPTGLVKQSLSMGKVANTSVLTTTASCRGLVLLDRVELHYDDDNIYHRYHVLNPSTGDLLDLPGSSVTSDARCHPDCQGWYDKLFGLGYDQSTKEYKVVRIYSHESSSHPSETSRCEIITLGTSAHWRAAIGCPPSGGISWMQREGVFSNGHLHWMLIEFPADNSDILSFNVHDESFGTIKPPSGIRTSYMGALIDLDGRLGLSCRSRGWGEEAIWILQDYETGRWEKLYAFDLRAWPTPERDMLGANYIIPLAMYYGSGRERKIMFISNYGVVFTVNVDSGAREILLLPEPEWRYGIEDPKLQVFEESLVSVVHP